MIFCGMFSMQVTSPINRKMCDGHLLFCGEREVSDVVAPLIHMVPATSRGDTKGWCG